MPVDPARAKSLFLASSDFADPAERSAYLDRECGGDAELRERVEALLRANDAAPLPSAVAATMDSVPGQPASKDREDPTAQVGAVIAGKYTLAEVIGEGGMGSVWRAKQSEPVKRFVAVKLIKAGMDSRQVLARFDAERQALALMDHPNIAKVLDGGLHERRPFFVMELVKGTPITEFCDAGKLTPKARLELFVQACQAIQHAHQKGIIHRDIKPSNVLVALYDDKPVVKVIDFGVAKATGGVLTEATIDTGFGSVVGTPAYMSPEQATFNNLDIDTRSDVYALGVLLYELLAGSPPFSKRELERKGLLEMLRVVREEEPPRPSTKLSTADALPTLSANRGTEPKKLTGLLRNELDWIVMKALEKDRARRYETANGFAADVQRYLSGEAVQAHPPSTAYRLKKFVRRNRGQMIAASLVLLSLVAGVVGTTWGLIEARRQAGIARGEASAKEIAYVEEARQRGIAESNERKAVAAAEQEQQARVQIASQLKQIEGGNEVINSIFTDLDIREVRAGTEPLEAVLAKRLVKAAAQLEGEAVGDPLAVARLQDRLGGSLLSLGYPADAVPLLLKARETRAAKLGADHPATLKSMNNLGRGYVDAERLDLALPLLEEALKFSKAKHGADHPDTLMSMSNLAGGYRVARKWDLALPLMEETLKLQKAKLGADDPGTLVSINNLAEGYHAAGKLELALPLLEEALKLMKAKHGADHPLTLASMGNLAGVYRDAGKLDLALPLLEETLKLRQARLGADHSETLVAMGHLALGYGHAGKPDLALPLYEEAVRLTKAKLGADHTVTLTSMSNLATFYWSRKQLDKSIPLFEEALNRREKRLGRQHYDTLGTVANLGVNYKDAGRLAEAIPLLEEAYRAAKKYPALSWVGRPLLEAYQKAGENAKLANMLQEQLPEARKALPKDSPQLAGLLAQIGLGLLEQNMWAEAEPLLRESLDIREKTQPEVWSTFNTQSLLGGALLGQKKYADAEPLLLKGYEGMKAREAMIPEQGKVRLPKALDRLIELYTETSKPDEVKKWQAERAKYPPAAAAATNGK